MNHNFDLLIIGAGPAGLAAAKRAAQYGVTVAIAEQRDLGGCCVNRGCIPKKLMVYTADYAIALKHATAYGWEQCSSQLHWSQFRATRDRELQRLRQVQHQSLQQAGVHLLDGHAQFLDAHTLDIAGQKYTASRILIAVGGKPMIPDTPGMEHAMTSDQLLMLEQLPHRVAIVGGGYVGVEFASILQALGCDVTIMNREHCILEGFDEDVRSAVRNGLLQRGIQSFCTTTTDHIRTTPEGICLTLTGDCPKQLVVDAVLCAIGRAPDLGTLGLEQAGVEFDKAIVVDDHSRTTQPHIYAVGDCTHRKQLTPVARAEGQAAVENMFGQGGDRLDYSLIPSAVLSRPEAASVGLTEVQAREQYGNAVECHRQEFVPLRYSLMEQQQQAFLKLVIDRQHHRILGIHMVGENAGEVIQSGAIALQRSLSPQALRQVIGIHPSSTEELFSAFRSTQHL